MELKPYQQQVINDGSLFLEQVQETKDVKEAFYSFWATHPKTPLFPFAGTAIEPYKNNVARVPHICIKVRAALLKGNSFNATSVEELLNIYGTNLFSRKYQGKKSPSVTALNRSDNLICTQGISRSFKQ